MQSFGQFRRPWTLQIKRQPNGRSTPIRISIFSRLPKRLSRLFIAHPPPYSPRQPVFKEVWYTKRLENFNVTDTSLISNGSPSRSGLIRKWESRPRSKEASWKKGGRLTERRSSLAYVCGCNAVKGYYYICRWQETKMKEREASRRGYYICMFHGPKKKASVRYSEPINDF